MSETPADAAPAKSNSKKLIIIAAVAIVLVVAVAAVLLVAMKNRYAGDEGGSRSSQAAPKAAPVFLPMENMVANLADPGGDRFAQVGITLELADSKTSDQVKAVMPRIRDIVLKRVASRTSDELLSSEGKDKLAQDVRRDIARELGYKIPSGRKQTASDDDEEDDAPRRDDPPVRQVLFSSFIVQ